MYKLVLKNKSHSKNEIIFKASMILSKLDSYHSILDFKGKYMMLSINTII